MTDLPPDENENDTGIDTGDVPRPEQPPMTDDASGLPVEDEGELGDELGDFA